MSEILVASEFIYQKLTSDSIIASLVGNRVYYGQGGSESSFPFILYYVYIPREDVVTVSGIRIMAEMDFVVKAITNETSIKTISDIDERVDQILHRASGTVSNGVVESCVRVNPFAYNESSDGITYRHVGGVYRMQIRRT